MKALIFYAVLFSLVAASSLFAGNNNSCVSHKASKRPSIFPEYDISIRNSCGKRIYWKVCIEEFTLGNAFDMPDSRPSGTTSPKDVSTINHVIKEENTYFSYKINWSLKNTVMEPKCNVMSCFSNSRNIYNEMNRVDSANSHVYPDAHKLCLTKIHGKERTVEDYNRCSHEAVRAAAPSQSQVDSLRSQLIEQFYRDAELCDSNLIIPNK